MNNTRSHYRLRQIALLILILHSLLSSGQSDYFEAGRLRYDDRSYQPYIKTVQLFRTGSEVSNPVIDLYGGETLTLRFDDLDDQSKDLQYKVLHCTWNWQPSSLLESDYLDGMWSDRIRNRDFSFNTLVPYVHYNLELPNESMRITRSGNYLLVVYEEGNPDQPLLSRRFMVVEPGIELSGRIRDARNASDRRYRQELSIELLQKDVLATDPFGQLKLVLMQNMRWDDLRLPKPQFINGNKILFQDSKELVFDGGNEYRNFDLRSLLYNTEFVEHIELLDNATRVDLRLSEKRNISVYQSVPDLNGRYFVKNQEGFDDPLESDYVQVRFTLKSETPYVDGNLYVFGALYDRRVDEASKMVYSEKMGVYFHQALVKQGWYDYQFAFLADTAEVADLGFIEGNHSQAENDYLVLVYYHDRQMNYDRLVGVRSLNSMRDRY